MADIPLAGQTDTFSRASKIFGGLTPEDFGAYMKAVPGLDPNTLFQTVVLGNLISPDGGRSEQERIAQEQREEARLNRVLDAQATRQAQQARDAQKLGKESLAFTSLYNQINKLPGTIASAFGGAGERELMANLYGQIPSIVSETYRTFPRQQIQPVGYSTPAGNYFS
jgi:hypothetical protein